MVLLRFLVTAALLTSATLVTHAAPMQLPEQLNARVEELSKAGDELVTKRSYREAIEKYIQALQLLPEPITDWGVCTRLLTAIGNANFLYGSYEYARRALSDAMHCPGAIGTPFIHMRLGQAQYELGNMERAADELARAYIQEGLALFEHEDPKYVVFVKSKLRPPPSGWPKGW